MKQAEILEAEGFEVLSNEAIASFAKENRIMLAQRAKEELVPKLKRQTDDETVEENVSSSVSCDKFAIMEKYTKLFSDHPHFKVYGKLRVVSKPTVRYCRH